MFGEILNKVHECRPLVHNITNYVTVNDVANAILACGGSPIMSDEPEDVYDIVSVCGGLNINIGTLNKRSIDAMFISGKRAKELGHPIVLDPVGAGASALRTNLALRILEDIKPDVIKGNISEIKALSIGNCNTKGVDADISDAVTEENLQDSIDFVKKFAQNTGSVIAVTGAIDLVSNGEKCFVIRNGKAEMKQITGTGCQLSGVVTAYITANKKNKFESVAASVCVMGLAGEIAYDKLLECEGNSTYRNKIIDAIFNMTATELEKGAKYELR